MSEHREPACPDYTCAAIDDAASELRAAADSLEDLRTANEQLRVWGSWWAERAAELELELEAAQDELAELQEIVEVDTQCGGHEG